ncbi:hypothetical protein EMPS_09199 [Entomortierella parvispora]|uniref:DUF202 domain-containing protein n=1 Tax=Entomortierella parvispora TaxID=205924 RepID=A0A9P3M0D0_9FUNG|nr:hypothetical protein EMPS_09199 [Entomortierella parvispora]
MNVGQSLLQGSPPRSMNASTYNSSPSSGVPHPEKGAADTSETIIDLEDGLSHLSTSAASPPRLELSAHLSSFQHEEKSDDGQPASQKMSWRRSLGLGGSKPSSEPRPWPYIKDGRQASKDSNRTLTEGLGLATQEDMQKTATTTSTIGNNNSGSWNPYKLTLDIPPPLHSVYGMSGTRNPDSKDPLSQPSSAFLLHTLSPSSTPLAPPPPPPTATGISPSGKRYVDPRKRNKSQKDAFKTGKVLFSNERTFIHWIKFGMLLGALAMTLLNFSGESVQRSVPDQELARRAGQIGQQVGVALLVICMLCLTYATAIFHWRHLGVVRKKNDDRYFDRIGPTALTFGLFIAYALNVFLTLQISASMDPNYQPTSLYNNHHTVNGPGYRPPSAMPSPSVFDTPPLPPGSTILVDEDDDDEDRDMDDQDSALETKAASTNNPSIASVPGNDQVSTQSSAGSLPVSQSNNGPTTGSSGDEEEDEEEEE